MVPRPVSPQPDSSVTPFFDSLVRQLGIADVFSLQMCGAGLSASGAANSAGGSLVSIPGGGGGNPDHVTHHMKSYLEYLQGF